MASIRILKMSPTEETSTRDPTDEWDRPDTSTTHFIEGFTVESKWHDFSVDFEPNYDSTYFLLYAVYSTGDSFGHDHNGGIEYLGLFENYETAELNLKRVEAMTDYGSCTLLTDFSMDYDVYCPWFGYFESLSYIKIESISRAL